MKYWRPDGEWAGLLFVWVVLPLFILFMAAGCSSPPEGVIATTTTTTTLPVATLPGRPSNLGAFIQGWDTPSYDLAMQQTYVNVDSLYLWKRIAEMDNNPRFVYIEASTYTIEEILDRSLDDEWLTILDQLPSNTIFAPIAEANGNWVTYHGTVAQVTEAYRIIAELDAGRHTMCGSFTVMGGSQAYLAAVAEYVDYACPSHYTRTGKSATTMGNEVKAHAASAGLPLIWAQGGTLVGDKVEWMVEAANAVAPSIFIYFNAGEWSINGTTSTDGGGWPW